MLNRVQLLRGVAAYMVVLFHCAEFLRGNTSVSVPFAHIGAAGVDIFFVISGFIMVYVTRPEETPSRFALNRMARIVPLYWLATAAAIVASVLVPWSFQNASINLKSVLGSFAFIPVPDARGAFEPILFLGWTLNYEMAFYSLFALSLFVPGRYRLATLFAGLFALFAVGRLSAQSNGLSFYGNPILFEFAGGCLIGSAVRTLPHVLRRVSPVFVILLGAAAIFFSAILNDPSLYRAAVWGIPAFLIVLGTVVSDLRDTSQTRLPCVSLGDASYSAYLLHPFVITTVGVLTVKVLGQGWAAAFIILGTSFLGTALVSAISLRVVERPSADLIRRAFDLAAPRSKAPGMGKSPRQ